VKSCRQPEEDHGRFRRELSAGNDVKIQVHRSPLLIIVVPAVAADTTTYYRFTNRTE
jgi:hypothetical protein